MGTVEGLRPVPWWQRAVGDASRGALAALRDHPEFTNRYQRFRPDRGAPVRTTVGVPRFPLPYDLAGYARFLAPSYAMLKMAEGPYRYIYMERLEAAAST